MIEIVDGIYSVKRTWGSNVYVLPGASPSLIDAGFPMDARRIIKRLERVGSKANWLMVATHYHLDHTGSMRRISEQFNVEVAAHHEDAAVMEGKVPYETFRLRPFKTAYYKALSLLFNFKFQYVDVDMPLEEGDVIDVIGGLEVMHVPGHTRGSIVLYQRERKILFSGDTLRNENSVLEGPPPQFTPRLDDSFRHIREKILPLDFEVLLPGHGEPILHDADVAVKAMMDESARLE